jgi:hypothetical protein
MNRKINDIILLILIFSGNIFISEHYYFFLLIYFCLIFHHLYICYFLLKIQAIQYFELKKFIFISLLLYIFTYFIIYDPNPFFYFIAFYSFYPDFIKAVLIILIHTYFISYYINSNKNNIINHSTEVISSKFDINKALKKHSENYFFSTFIKYLSKEKHFKSFYIGLILFFIIEIITFVNRIKLWVFLNEKEKTLPISASRNSTFYITSNVVNVENIIDNYIQQLKFLINYLGESNVIISIVENEDSKDNTRKFLKDFQNYLTEKNILNKFYLERVIEDPRKLNNPFEKYSRLRIEYFAKLRNKCLDFLYELPNIDFNNTIIIFMNDIVFKYEDIINLLSTNNENYDVACALDMNSNTFYDRWVSIDLEGEGMRKFFPFFINKEGQDLVVNHKPIRVFSCWNGAIVFRALPLKDKKVQFRHKVNYSIPRYNLNNPAKDYYESECTYFNIDLFTLGYKKKFINPDVRVTYKHEYFFESKYFIPSFKHIFGYLLLYFVGMRKKRNKFFSDYKSDEIKINSVLHNWYLENKKDEV